MFVLILTLVDEVLKCNVSGVKGMNKSGAKWMSDLQYDDTFIDLRYSLRGTSYVPGCAVTQAQGVESHI